MSEMHDDAVVQSSPTLGERLRQAREAKKYSITEVAAQLRLPKEIVSYMENQQWDKLHGRTYARGYFASYVKFLGLPFDEMLAVFNLDYTSSEPVLNLMPPSPDSHQKPLPWLMMTVVAVLLLVIWLAFQQWQKTQAIEAVSLTETEQLESDSGFNESVVEPLTPEMKPIDSDTAEQGGQLQPVVQTAEALGMSEERLSEITAVEEDAVINEQTQPVEQVSVSSETRDEQTVIQTESILKLTFTGECWVEVTNADSQVLVSKVMQAEQSILLKSDQPLNILLGRAKVAAVTFNNQSVDLTPHLDGDVARLTLGVES
jgi:cytoskeleton protein RodZ